MNSERNARRKILWMILIFGAVMSIPFTEAPPKIWSVAINPAAGEDYKEEIKVQYNILTSRKVSPAEVLDYVKDDFGSLNSAEKTKLMYRFERYMAYQIPAFDEKLFYNGNHKMVYKYFFYAYDPNVIATITEEPFKRTMTELAKSGYILKRIRNMYHPEIDYNFLKTTFSGMSDEGLKYLELQQSYKEWSGNKINKRVQGVKNVENLLLKCDYFINRFPLSEKTQEIQTIFTTLLEDYIYGNKEFETFNNYTGQVDQILIDSYFQVGTHFYDRNLGNVLIRYSKMVKRNGCVVTNDHLNYVSDGIQKNRREDVHALIDRIQLFNIAENIAGNRQYIPQLYGFRDRVEQKELNEIMLENVHKYVFQGWNRGYNMRVNALTSKYQITHNRMGLLSLYQSIDLTYNDHKMIRHYECLNYDFDRKKKLLLPDCFVNYQSQKRKILEVLEQELQLQNLGPFERVQEYELEKIDNFVITNDGIEVFLKIVDDAGRYVKIADVELSYSDFSTIIQPDFKL